MIIFLGRYPFCLMKDNRPWYNFKNEIVRVLDGDCPNLMILILTPHSIYLHLFLCRTKFYLRILRNLKTRAMEDGMSYYGETIPHYPTHLFDYL